MPAATPKQVSASATPRRQPNRWPASDFVSIGVLHAAVAQREAPGPGGVPRRFLPFATSTKPRTSDVGVDVDGKVKQKNFYKPSETRVYFKALSLRTRTHGARALLPATRCQSSGPLGALLSSPALDVRLLTALQVLQRPSALGGREGPRRHRAPRSSAETGPRRSESLILPTSRMITVDQRADLERSRGVHTDRPSNHLRNLQPDRSY